MNLSQQLKRYDGKSLAPFRKAADQLRDTPNPLALLLRLAAEEDRRIEIGATWIIKNLVESGEPTSSVAVLELLGLIESVSSDEALLHLLQTLPHLPLDGELLEPLQPRLEELLERRNKFVRAWTYNALGLLALHCPRYRTYVSNLFEQARQTESAAVLARIRKIAALIPDSTE